jgi:hypothetical protein
VTCHKTWTRRAVIAALLGLATLHPAAASPSPFEQKLIDQLIREVGEMRDVVFIRNGSEYSAHDAEAHLRDKMDYFKDDIHTAEDFIRLCATRSEMTGASYKIRDASGHVHESAVFLKARLDQLRASAVH